MQTDYSMLSMSGMVRDALEAPGLLLLGLGVVFVLAGVLLVTHIVDTTPSIDVHAPEGSNFSRR
jgi:hypothetical protein